MINLFSPPTIIDTLLSSLPSRTNGLGRFLGGAKMQTSGGVLGFFYLVCLIVRRNGGGFGETLEKWVGEIMKKKLCFLLTGVVLREGAFFPFRVSYVSFLHSYKEGRGRH